MLPYIQKHVTDIAMFGKENATKEIILDKTVIFQKKKKNGEKAKKTILF